MDFFSFKENEVITPYFLDKNLIDSTGAVENDDFLLFNDLLY